MWRCPRGGYYNNANDNCDDLLIKEKSYIDNATPSPNGVAIANLVRLGFLTDNLEYFDKAEKTLKLFGDIMKKSPVSCPSLFVALNWYLQGTSVKTTKEVKSQINQQYLPTTVYRITEKLPSNSIGVVCSGLSCFEPAITIDQLLKQIKEIRVS